MELPMEKKRTRIRKALWSLTLVFKNILTTKFKLKEYKVYATFPHN